MKKDKLVLIGNGMAGVRTIDELLKLTPEKYDITVFGAEPYGNYNRILLSPVLTGEKTIKEIMLNDLDWYEQNNIKLYTSKKIVEIDRLRRKVIADDGTEALYDRLLLATGSKSFIIPLPGHDLPGVIGFRDIYDVDAMLKAAQTYKKAVVIGGGLLGLEAANGLLTQGMDVTVVHLLDTLMERQLDKPAADLLQRSLEQRGLKFEMQAQTAAILGDQRVRGIRFADGREIEADLVVMAVGIRRPVCIASAASWSMTQCRPMIHASMQWVNASNIAAIPMVWSRRCSSRPRCVPIISLILVLPPMSDH
jgi:nitrite reductase (NADH) large subunit